MRRFSKSHIKRKKSYYTPDGLKYLLIALFMLVAVKTIQMYDFPPNFTPAKPQQALQSYIAPPGSKSGAQNLVAVQRIRAPETIEQPTDHILTRSPAISPESEIPPLNLPIVTAPPIPAVKPSPELAKKLDMVSHYKWADGKPRIVIIIDDMGLNRKYSDAIADLPAPLTLAFLPYAEDLNNQTKRALQKGHELMIHTPMEPINPDLDMGPIALSTDMSIDQIKDVMNEQVLSAFSGYKGINNHMGSRLTQDKKRMRAIMKILKEHGLYFIDSKTIGNSQAASEAAKAGIAFAERHVFLDHYTTEKDVERALDQLERVARLNGVGIAIGHPKERTFNVLQKWLPRIESRGLVLVPAGEVVRSLDDIQAAPKNEVSHAEKRDICPYSFMSRLMNAFGFSDTKMIQSRVHTCDRAMAD